MKSLRAWFLGWLLCGAWFSGAAEGQEARPPRDVKFARKPLVSGSGGNVKIEFSAAGPTDCAVSILDSSGKVVRHLVAGVLGDKPPAPLRPGLDQSLAWDGKDNLGRPATGGPFRARVSLGLTPAFERILGWDPLDLGSVRALATGPEGHVYVFHAFGNLHPDDNSLTCVVLNREGQYVKTVLPYPANLPEERLRGLRRLALADGTHVPFLYQGETRSLIPGAGSLPRQRPAVTRDGKLTFVGIQELGRYAQAGVNQLVVLNTDGSPAAGGPLRAILSKKASSGANLALSPDEKTVYACGLVEDQKPANVLYAFGWSDKEPRVLVPADRLQGPSGLAVDAQGNILVAERGQNRVSVFTAQGEAAGSLEVPSPEWVEVDRQSGAVYVLHGPKSETLSKFAGWRDAKKVASVGIKGSRFDKTHHRPVMALDAGARPPIVWIGSPVSADGFTLLRVEDRGTSFGEPAEIAKPADASKPSVGSVMAMTLDRQNGRLYVNGRCYDVKEGTWKAGLKNYTGEKVGMGSFGLDGNLYVLSYPKTLRRYGPDLKPLPFTGSPGGTLQNPLGGTSRLRERGVTSDAHGNIYVLWQKQKGSEGAMGDANALCMHGPDGRMVKESLIDSDLRLLSSVRVDPAGNIYVAAGLKPGREAVPAELKGQVGEDPREPGAVREVNYYSLMYGSILKFGPQGGAIGDGVDGPTFGYGFGPSTKVKGAQWAFFGVSSVPSWRTEGSPDICLCESPRFDVDGFGRSFFPDCLRFRVGVIDTAGREICSFGSYGNADSAGPRGAVPVPAIPFQWPDHVCVSDDAVYVGDRLNRRVVVVKLAYAAEEIRAVP